MVGGGQEDKSGGFRRNRKQMQCDAQIGGLENQLAGMRCLELDGEFGQCS